MDVVSIAGSLLDHAKGEADLARMVRAYVDQARATLFARHRAGAGGREIVTAYSALIDHLLCHLFAVISENFIRRYPSLNPRCALVAQGGYGRGELNPYSDIDLLFLYYWKVTPYVEAVTEKLLYTLWDAGLQVGHATRSAGDCVRFASGDMKVRTSLLDTRYLCGSHDLYMELERAVERKLLKRRAHQFVEEKLQENKPDTKGTGDPSICWNPTSRRAKGGCATSTPRSG